jgi:hypothetical protein
MGTKTPKMLDFDRLADALTAYHAAYLVTVDDEYRVHTVDVEPKLTGRLIEVGLIGGKTRRNIEMRSAVTLLWPPSERSGYSLIVDGISQLDDAAADGDTAALFVTPTRALLHRKADSVDGGVRHDCVVFSRQ